MERCHSCRKFIQDTDPNEHYCTGDNCYANIGFPEYDPIGTNDDKDLNKTAKDLFEILEITMRAGFTREEAFQLLLNAYKE